MIHDVLCSVCNTNPGSYKCPKCREPYCCLECYKIHKTYCGDKIPKEETLENNEYPSDQMIDIPPFELFRSNKQIIDALGDPRLQEIIARIDSSSDRENTLIHEMEINPDFEVFVNQLLEAAPPTIQP